MKTLKISLVATLAAALAWWMRLPHKTWPHHPRFADFLFAFILCIVLQAVWPDTSKEPSGTAKDAGKTAPH